jgi:transcriptional regulatory protein GAL4
MLRDASLVSDAIASHLIDAYFKLYNSSYPILHEQTFRRQRERYRHRPATDNMTCWMAIYHLVLAIGNWTVNQESQESAFFAAARSWLSARALESGTLGSVQAFLLMVRVFVSLS